MTITPLLNRCVVFETNEYSWHGFPRIELPEDKQHLSRKSFALYYYTDTRPVDDTGPEHSTIYVEQHLPEDWHEGMTLSAEQLQHAHNLVASRDQHLKRLYDDIKRITGERNQARDQLVEERERATSGIHEADAPMPEPEVAAEGESREDQLERTLSAREADIRRLRRRINDLEASTSWRVTRPLRGIKRLLGGG